MFWSTVESFENSRKINKVNLKKRSIQRLPRQEPGPFELKKTKNFGHKITFHFFIVG